MISVRGLTKRFHARTILDDVTIDVDKGKVTVVCGPSGCGKSTLMRCIVGLERFDRGSIRVGDVELGPLGGPLDERRAQRAAFAIRLRAGMVFQHYGLFAHMTVLENVIEAPLRVRHVARADAIARARSLLEDFGLAHRSDARPRELSGGEQQRVAIARALAMEPEALLLDEPTSALDPDRKKDVTALLARIAERGTALVIVTHEPELVSAIADRAILMREGRVVADGPPGDVLRA